MRFSTKNSTFIFQAFVGLITVAVMASVAGAATLSESYPDMQMSVFSGALLESLPEGTLLQAKDLTITQADLDGFLEELKEQFEDDVFVSHIDLLEMFSLEKIISAEVLQDKDKKELSDPDLKKLVQEYAQGIVADVTVSDEEALAFFKEHESQLGEHQFEDIKEDLKRMIKPEKSQEAWKKHLQSLGGSIPIRLQEDWIQGQVEHFQSNPIEAARKSGKPAFIDFSATWCGPCQRLKPIVEGLEKKYGDQINIVVIDVDEQPFLAQHYGASSFPYLVFYDKDGKDAGDIRGFVPEAELLQKFESLGVK